MKNVTEVKLDYVKSTKRTHVFQNKTVGISIPTIYIAKNVFEKQPEYVKLTVEVEDGN